MGKPVYALGAGAAGFPNIVHRLGQALERESKGEHDLVIVRLL